MRDCHPKRGILALMNGHPFVGNFRDLRKIWREDDHFIATMTTLNQEMRIRGARHQNIGADHGYKF